MIFAFAQGASPLPARRYCIYLHHCFENFSHKGNNADGSVVVPKTPVLSLTTVLTHKYGSYIVAFTNCECAYCYIIFAL